MSKDESSKFYELKAFKDHLETCAECQTKADEVYQEILAHAEHGSNEEKNQAK